MPGRIVCVEREPCWRQGDHIVAVGVGSQAGRARLRLSAEEVAAEIRHGGRFYVMRNGIQLSIQMQRCSCGELSLSMLDDAARIDVLEELRACVWRPSPDKIP